MKYLILAILTASCTPTQVFLPAPKCVFGDTAQVTGNSFYSRCKGVVEDYIFAGSSYRYLLNDIECVNVYGNELGTPPKNQWFEESQLNCTK